MEWPLIWWKYETGEVEGEGYFYCSNSKVDNSYNCFCNYDANNNIINHFYTAIYNGTCAATYSASSTYAVGDLVTYDSAEYKCTSAISVAEAWNSAHW